MENNYNKHWNVRRGHGGKRVFHSEGGKERKSRWSVLTLESEANERCANHVVQICELELKTGPDQEMSCATYRDRVVRRTSKGQDVASDPSSRSAIRVMRRRGMAVVVAGFSGDGFGLEGVP